MNSIFNFLRENYCQLKIHYPINLSLKDRGKINIKHMLTYRFSLKEFLRCLFQEKEKMISNEAPDIQRIISQKYGIHVYLNKHILYKTKIISYL